MDSAAVPRPADLSGPPVVSSGRLKWSDAETELLYRMDSLIKDKFTQANIPLALPSTCARMQALNTAVPLLKASTLTSRYASIRKGSLPRPDNFQLPERYVVAVQQAAEELLAAALAGDQAKRGKRPTAAAAGDKAGGRSVRARVDDGGPGSAQLAGEPAGPAAEPSPVGATASAAASPPAEPSAVGAPASAPAGLPAEPSPVGGPADTPGHAPAGPPPGPPANPAAGPPA